MEYNASWYMAVMIDWPFVEGATMVSIMKKLTWKMDLKTLCVEVQSQEDETGWHIVRSEYQRRTCQLIARKYYDSG